MLGMFLERTLLPHERKSPCAQTSARLPEYLAKMTRGEEAVTALAIAG